MKGTIAKGNSTRSVQESGKSRSKTSIKSTIMAETISDLKRSNRKLTSQYAVLDIPWMNCMCFRFLSFSWQTNAIVEACISA